MEICVNEYIRTWDGIKKIVKINEGKDITIYGKYIVEPQYKNSSSISVNNILKHSPNIIDLVQEGDYVNGHLVYDKYLDTNDNGKDFITIIIENTLSVYKCLEEKDINSIVTKEQFNKVKYEV